MNATLSISYFINNKTTMTTPSHLRHLLASAHTPEALEQLSAWAENQGAAYRQAALLLQAAWASNEQQASRGLIANEEAERTRNRITAGALGLIDEIESGASAPKAVLEGLQKQFHNERVQQVLQSGNFSDFSGSKIHVQGSQDVVIGSGNVITKKKIAGLARGQFLGIAAGLLLLVLGGYFAFDLLRDRQEETYVSLLEIRAELKMRSELDAGVRSRLENSAATLERWLTDGMNAFQRKEYPAAVENLEKVAAEVPLATVHQNLSYAYRQLGNAEKARENIETAQEINSNLDAIKSLTPENGEGVAATSNPPKSTLKNRSEKINLAQGLVAYYPFNGNANDESGNGNDGKVYGATLTTDRKGNANKAYSFNGIGNYIDCNLSPVFVNHQNLTISGWVSVEKRDEKYEYNVVVGNLGNLGSGGYQVELSNVPYNIQPMYRDHANSDRKLQGVSIFENNAWNNFTVTYLSSGTSTVISLYVNGVIDNTATLNGSISYDNVSSLLIGTNKDGIDSRMQRFFNGKIDDIRIYNRILTGPEIRALYKG